MPKRFGLDGAGKGGGDVPSPPPPPPPPPPLPSAASSESITGSAAARVAPASSLLGQLLALAVASPALAAAVIAGEEAETRIPGADGKGGTAVSGGGDGPAGGGITAPVRERLRASGTMEVGSSCGEVCSGCSHSRGAHAEPAEMMREVVMVRA